MSDDPQAEAALAALLDQTEHYTLRALGGINGAREDVALAALAIAAYIVARRTAEVHGVKTEDKDALAGDLMTAALRHANEYARILEAEGAISYAAEVREHRQSDAERRALGEQS